MSIGLGDAITALTVAFQTCMKIKNGPSEIEDVMKASKRARNILQLLQDHMGDPKTGFYKSEDKIKSMLSSDMADISEGVKEIKSIVKERLAIPKWELGSYCSWLLIRVPKLKFIAETFDAAEERIDRVISIVNSDALTALQAQLSVNEEKQRRAAYRQQQANIENLVASFAQNAKLVTDEAIHGGRKNEETWIKQLVQGGMKKQNAETTIESIINTVRTEHFTIANASPSPRPPPVLPFHPPPSTLHPPPSPKPPKDTSMIRILVVDSSNGARSIITQTYLELLRSWTMNTQKRWLFNRVHSVGIGIPTPFTRPHLGLTPSSDPPKIGIPASKEALTAISGGKSFFWSSDPDEKKSIRERVGKHRSVGFHEGHLHTYTYILCFDEDSRRWLEWMKSLAIANTQKPNAYFKIKVISKITYLNTCEWFRTWKHNNAADLQRACGAIKWSAKKFIAEKLGWKRPVPGIAHGPWRTLRLVVTKDLFNKIANDNYALRQKIQNMGCKINRGPEYMDELFLVSISGPRERLEECKKMLVEN